MILVDSSVWVDYFNGAQTAETDCLHESLAQEPVVIGDLILTEVLQGFRADDDYRHARALLTGLTIRHLLGTEYALRAADNFRSLRKRGVTVRKTVDIIIGTWCIETRTPLLYSDRDFDPMVRHLGLKSALSS